MEAMMTFNGMSEDKTLPSKVTFGDIRRKPLSDMFQYFRLNRYQRNEIKWIANNHLANYCELHEVSSETHYHSLTMTRLGSSPQEKLIIVTSSIWFVDSLDLKHRETRHIKIGIKGGKVLLNPERKGTFVGGKAVLRVPAKVGL